MITTSFVRYISRWFIIFTFAVLVFPVSFSIDRINLSFQKADAEQGDKFFTFESEAYRLAWLAATDDINAAITSSSVNMLSFATPNGQGAALLQLWRLDQLRELQFDLFNQSPGNDLPNIARRISLREIKNDIADWFHLGTNQVLLAFGLVGFFSSRKKRDDTA